MTRTVQLGVDLQSLSDRFQEVTWAAGTSAQQVVQRLLADESYIAGLTTSVAQAVQQQEANTVRVVSEAEAEFRGQNARVQQVEEVVTQLRNELAQVRQQQRAQQPQQHQQNAPEADVNRVGGAAIFDSCCRLVLFLSRHLLLG